MKLLWSKDSMADIKSFGFDLDTIDEYTTCCCGSLANVLSKKLGWEIYQVDDVNTLNGRRTFGIHYVVKTPDGYYMDILGIWTENALLQYWYDYNLEISERNSNLVYSLVLSTSVEVCDCDNMVDHISNEIIKHLL